MNASGRLRRTTDDSEELWISVSLIAHLLKSDDGQQHVQCGVLPDAVWSPRIVNHFFVLGFKIGGASNWGAGDGGL